MALLDFLRNFEERTGKRIEENIGGLLGEDLSKLSEAERKAIRRQARMRSLEALGGLGSQSAAMAGVAESVGKRLEAKRAKDRQAEAEAMMPRIAGRLFGGAPAATMPEDSSDGLTGVNVQSRYRQDPAEAMRMMMGSQAGRDLAALQPDLAKLAQEGVTGRTVGGAVYNPLTGQFSKPEEAKTRTLSAQEISQLGLPRGTVAQIDPSGDLRIVREPRLAGAGGGTAKFTVLSERELLMAGLPKGTVAQRNNLNGEVKILSSVPQAERTSISNRERAVKRVELGTENIQKQLDKVSTGGILGASGAISRVFDSQDAKQFETYREQLSSALRAALRIPGEGSLSDRDLAQYGLTLPSLGLSKQRNIEIMRALEDQVRVSADSPTLAEEKPPELDDMTWRAMLPSERAAYKKAGTKR
jgi:hypothetical protein